MLNASVKLSVYLPYTRPGLAVFQFWKAEVGSTIAWLMESPTSLQLLQAITQKKKLIIMGFILFFIKMDIIWRGDDE